MADFEIDTRVQGDDGHYTAALSPEWSAWGPSGGYIAAVLLRAAQAHSVLPRAASISVHFLSKGKFGPVGLTARTLRVTRRTESLQVTMEQESEPVAQALIWLTADGLDGLRHDRSAMPDVPRPGQLRPVEELAAEATSPPAFLKAMGFLDHVEWRPTLWHDDWDNRPAGEPRWHAWYRYRSRSTFDDPVVDTARSLILLDSMGWASAVCAHPPDVPYMAPNLDLTVQFHRNDPGAQWLYAAGYAPVAQDGLVAFRSSVWSENGYLLASGSGQLLCRSLRVSQPG
jgi:acyl-CoA thioesterase